MRFATRQVCAAILAAVFVPCLAAPVALPAAGSMEVAFSPRGGGQQLVLKAIDSARHDIRVLAYGFTSAPVTAALVEARKRGVDVALVVDQKSNVENAKSRAALGALVAAGVTVRTTSAWAIHHDKVIVVDGRHVQTGSFNYSAAAEQHNSENVLVAWNAPQLAEQYLRHWRRNWDSGIDFEPGFGR